MEMNLNTCLEDTFKGNSKTWVSSCSVQFRKSLSCWLLEGEKMLRDKDGSKPSLVCLLLAMASQRCWVSWFNPNQQLSPTQLLAHFPPVGWGRELEE